MWQVYHITGGLPVVVDLALAVDLTSDGTVATKAGELFYLTREALKRRAIDELWKAKAATSPKSLGKALLSESVVEAVRKELRRSTRQQVDSKEIRHLLSETVLRPECFDQRPGNSPL